jgi:thiamine-monophosphate kinase
MMDVSDGLLLDAARLAEASGCTADIALDAVPFADGITGEDRLEAARWGDDYELLFAAPQGWTPPVPATRIGTLHSAGTAPLLLDGIPPPGRLGYQHG